MKITGNEDILKYLNDTTVNRKEEKGAIPNEMVTPPVPEQTNDTVVNLSQRSKEIQVAQQAMNAEPDIRFDKVQDIAEKVKNGTYEVDYGKTGEKMLAAFIDEMG